MEPDQSFRLALGSVPRLQVRVPGKENTKENWRNSVCIVHCSETNHAALGGFKQQQTFIPLTNPWFGQGSVGTAHLCYSRH